MPAYAAWVLPDRAAEIYAYLQSLPGPRPVKDIPILNEARFLPSATNVKHLTKSHSLV
jgi:hypothetical protein